MSVIRGLTGKLFKGTVFLYIEAEGVERLGSGFIVDKGNFVITALHNLKDAKRVSIYTSEGDVQEKRICRHGDWSTGAEIQLYKDGKSTPYWNVDACIIHLNEKFDSSMALEFDDKPAYAGQEVLFSGYPYGGMKIDLKHGNHPPYPLVSKAIISGSARIGNKVSEFCYWLDKPSFEGHSGGPVMNIETNKIIGIISASPYMPSKILSENEVIPILIPIGFAIACGISLLPQVITDIKKIEPWKGK
jgi:hypothetical protein